jgi:tripeptidyl-peptidase-1
MLAGPLTTFLLPCRLPARPPTAPAATLRSASTPVVAGIVSLLNDIRRVAGKPPLGFLNPLLYKRATAAALHDITLGANEGCSGMGGFPARRGWDAVTGVGTPNFAKLADIVRALP